MGIDNTDNRSDLKIITTHTNSIRPTTIKKNTYITHNSLKKKRYSSNNKYNHIINNSSSNNNNNNKYNSNNSSSNKKEIQLNPHTSIKTQTNNKKPTRNKISTKFIDQHTIIIKQPYNTPPPPPTFPPLLFGDWPVCQSMLSPAVAFSPRRPNRNWKLGSVKARTSGKLCRWLAAPPRPHYTIISITISPVAV